MRSLKQLSRRDLLNLGVGAPLMLALVPLPADATPESMAEAIDVFTGGATVGEGLVKLDIPMLVENGSTVPLNVSVESPMTAEDFVETIAIFNEQNPLPDVARFHLTTQSGRAAVQTRIRLNGTQAVLAIAKMSDGNFWWARTHVVVTAPACAET